MKFNLGYFSPWISKEKTNIYIYSSYESYITGTFKPPKWSKGLAYVDKKTIVVYNDEKKETLFPTIIHELTHLYFESFFNEKLNRPPLWLNEGLAVYMENKNYEKESLWYRALKYSPQSSYYKFESFFRIDPKKLTTDNDISNWYLQAYGTTKYLFETRRLAFYKLAKDIRDGKKLEKALWDNYNITDFSNFEKKWFYWLNSNMKNNEEKNSFEFKFFKKIEFK